MDIIPIWRDYPIEITTTADYVDYTISLGVGGRDGVIYSGRAYKLPGATTVRIVPNEVCAPYVCVTEAPPIPNPIPPDDDEGEPGKVTPHGMAQYFVLKEASDTNHSFIFQADYSHVVPSHATCAPITGKVDRRQVVLTSSYLTPDYLYLIVQTFDDRERLIRSFQINSTLLDYAVGAFLRGKVLDGVAKIRVYTPNKPVVYYDVVDECLPYVIYYVNAYGGWDSLLVDGTVKQTDEYNRTTFGQSYSTIPTTDGVLERGTVCLQNDITRKYTLVTGWLTDDQASRMHHLLGSTNVYLRDQKTNQYVPVVLTNSSCEYKTYRNQGAQLVNYTIEATVAQTFTRR